MPDAEIIPLFPLRSVLFPRGKLSLQIFEKRYIDLVASTMRDESGFGVILLNKRQDKKNPDRLQNLHNVGTYARIIDWDQLENGLLGITVEGERKFHLEHYWCSDSDLYMGRVRFSDADVPGKTTIPVSEDMSGMTELLQLLERHPLVQEMDLKIDYDNLWDLGWRLSELIPVALEIKQELLELDDPWKRIQLLEQSIHYLIDD